MLLISRLDNDVQQFVGNSLKFRVDGVFINEKMTVSLQNDAKFIELYTIYYASTSKPSKLSILRKKSRLTLSTASSCKVNLFHSAQKC